MSRTLKRTARRVTRRTARRTTRSTWRFLTGRLDHAHRVRYADAAFRVRCSWWARWLVPAYALATVHALTEGHTILLWALTFATMIALVARPEWRARAAQGIRLRTKAKKARRGWRIWAGSRDARRMLTTAGPLRAAFTGETRHTPRIKRFTQEKNGKTFVIVAESPTGLSEEKWARNAPIIAQYMNLPTPTVEVDHDAREAILRFTGNGGQARIAKYPAKVPTVLPDLGALPVARTLDGSTARLPLAGGHVLIVGESGSGKGSVIWSIVRALAPGIRDGRVQVRAVDPKGGIELTPGAALFHRFQVGVSGDEQAALVALLEDLIATMKARMGRMRAAGARLHKITRGEPLIVLIFDEFLMLQNGMTDAALKKRANGALIELLSQGRAAGIVVVGAAQMAQKQYLGMFRDLFTVRVCLRASEPNQANLVLGEGALARGAAAHLIPRDARGAGYMLEEGGTPVMVRFPWSSDTAVKAMARDYAPQHEPPAEQPPAQGARSIGFTTGSPSGAGLGVAYEPATEAPAAPAGSGKRAKWDAVEAELDRLEAAGEEVVASAVAAAAGCHVKYVQQIIRERRKAAEEVETGAETGGKLTLETGPPDRNEVPEGDPISPAKSCQVPSPEELADLDTLWSLPAFGEADDDASAGPTRDAA